MKNEESNSRLIVEQLNTVEEDEIYHVFINSLGFKPQAIEC
jgi:hypothetical protein